MPGSIGRLKQRIQSSMRGRPGDAARSGGARGDRGRTGAGVGDHTGEPTGVGTGGVEVAYAPRHDGDPDPGEVVWAWVAYEDDPAQGKDRPVLVIGRRGTRLAAVPLSSRGHRSDDHEWVPVGTGPWDRQARPSYADASRLLILDPAAVRREGSALPRDRFDQVVARVARINHWTV